MLEPAYPPHECERIEELRGLRLLDTQPEERFDRITRLAQRLFNVEIALVSLVDVERQWFKSAQGLDAAETPRNISFCGHAILHDGAFIIENAATDPRFADNPLVTGAPHIRFYAGMPLRGPHGYRVGTLCIIDPAPRAFGADDVASLMDLAKLVEAEFNTRELSKIVSQATSNEARLRAILDHVVDGIITIDEQGMVETINPAVLRIFGYAEEEILGGNIKMLMPESDHVEHDDYLKNFRATGKPKVIGTGQEVLGQRKNGEVFPIYLAVSEMQLNGRRAFSGIVRDISERKHAEDALVTANAQLAASTGLQQAIMNSANFSMIATDIDGTIKLFSAGAERMLGYASGEMVDRQTPAILHEPTEVMARAAALSAELGCLIEPGFEVFVTKARSGVPDELEWTYVCKNGDRLPVMLSVTAIKNDDEQLTGFLGIAYDLTERKKIELMKSEFISTVSHELRTPLTSIRGSLGLLVAGAAGDIPQRAHALLEIANNNCERLVRLINDILDIEKIESGNMRFDMMRQRMAPLVEKAIEATQDFATQYGVNFLLQADDADVDVSVDADRITQVIVNLLSNAAKFSPPGVDVVIRLERQSHGMRMSVTDRGSGISAEFQARIFQKFAQADASDTRQKGGTGLGLSISKVIVEKHQGRIGFNTQQGVGTEFFFELPDAPESPEQQNAAPGQRRVLICEDDPDIAQSLSLMLAQGGLSSDVARDAAQARHLLDNGNYAAMTLDLSLPGEDGLSLLRWKRAQDKIANLPVLVLSARAEDGRKKMIGGSVGVVDWLTKPIDQKKLLDALLMATRCHTDGMPDVLYIEDDADLVQVVTMLLQPMLTVTHANTIVDAMEKLKVQRFSLIILDITLPDGSGTDLLAFLPELNASTPVMIFSGEEPSGSILDRVCMSLLKSHTSNEQLLSTIKGLIGGIHNDHSIKGTK